MPEKIPTQLIIRYLTNEATNTEQEELLEWVSLDKQNQKIFEEFTKAWENKNYTSRPANLDKGLKVLNSKIDAFESSQEQKRNRIPWMKIAASLLLLVVAGSAVTLSLNLFTFRESISLVIKENPAAGEVMTLQLSDGSTVKLNRLATLRYPDYFTDGNREVYLTGEAFFDIKKDPLHPFIIHTGNVTTEVLGTSFNIRSTAESVVVTVATGNVKVSDQQKQEILQPADQVTYSVATKNMVVNKADVENEMAWMTNTLAFNDHTLTLATQVLERRFNVVFFFENEAIKQCVITGKFRNETLEHILKAIAFSTGITYEIKNKEVYLSGKSCQ